MAGNQPETLPDAPGRNAIESSCTLMEKISCNLSSHWPSGKVVCCNELLWGVEPHAIPNLDPKRRVAGVAGLSPLPLAPAFGVADGRLGGERLRPLHRRSHIVVVQGKESWQHNLKAQVERRGRGVLATDICLWVNRGACRWPQVVRTMGLQDLRGVGAVELNRGPVRWSFT
jgi:hypothetical protein